jgi:MoaE-MoaD fusion protein
MRLFVRLFAVLRERAKTDRIEIEIAGDSASLKEVLDAVSARAPEIEPYLARVRVAKNEEFAKDDERVHSGDEIALIPPVSGGSGLALFRLTKDPIDEAAVVRAVKSGEAGAVVSFLGTVRGSTKGVEVVALEYEAYESMAERYLRSIGEEIIARWPGAKAAIVHRTGRLAVGETSVAIAVASPHRAEAFDACRLAIERLKKDVPIWKKEIHKDGSSWVGVGS